MQLDSLCSAPIMLAKFSFFVLLLAVDSTFSSTESEDSFGSETSPSRHKRAPGWGKRADNEFYGSPDSSPQVLLKRAPGWGKRSQSQFSGLASSEAANDLMEKRGWGKRGWGKRSVGDVEVEDAESLEEQKRAPGWGKRAPGWGKRAPGWGKRAPGWGKRAPGWGKRAPGWGKRSTGDYCETLERIVDNLIYKAVDYDSQRLHDCGSAQADRK